MASLARNHPLIEQAHQPNSPVGRAPRFDRIARPYRLMEYLSFGPMLESCRFHWVPHLARSRRALVFGDGDGRFLAKLLSANLDLQAEAVDASSAMLHLLMKRISCLSALHRITAICADARLFLPSGTRYDLVVTHFFLDCLTGPEADALITRVRARLAPGARWLVSEFQIPVSGRFRAWLARGIISALYAAFRLLTGLSVRKLPPWADLLARHGFRRRASHSSLGGLLVSELWELPQATSLRPQALPPVNECTRAV